MHFQGQCLSTLVFFQRVTEINPQRLKGAKSPYFSSFLPHPTGCPPAISNGVAPTNRNQNVALQGSGFKRSTQQVHQHPPTESTQKFTPTQSQESSLSCLRYYVLRPKSFTWRLPRWTATSGPASCCLPKQV